MKKYCKPLLISILEMLSKLVATCVVIICLYICGDEQVSELMSKRKTPDTIYPSDIVGYIYVVVAIFVTVLVKALDMANPMSVFNFKSINRKEFLHFIIGVIFLLLGVMSLSLVFGFTGDVDYKTSKSLIGLVLTSFFAAFISELVYRESIIRHLLNNGSSEWVAVLFSSFCFYVFRFYIASPIEALIGIILAYAYIKTKNVCVTFVIYFFYLFVEKFYITYIFGYVADFDFYNICLVVFSLFSITLSLYLIQKSNISNLTFDDKSV